VYLTGPAAMVMILVRNLFRNTLNRNYSGDFLKKFFQIFLLHSYHSKPTVLFILSDTWLAIQAQLDESIREDPKESYGTVFGAKPELARDRWVIWDSMECEDDFPKFRCILLGRR
jgi:hypothetical protein